MKRLTVIVFSVVLSFALLGLSSISEARGGHGGGGHGGGGGFHGGYSGGGYRVAPLARGYYGGYRGGYYGGYRGGYYGYHGGYYGGYWGRGFYPYWGFGLGWGLWGWPLLGWSYAGWPYYSYGGYPYLGWPYYSSAYPSDTATAPPAYNEPEQEQQSYYWYYCQNPQGYYPYIKSCPGGWMTVVPNVTPPSPSPGLTPPPSGLYLPQGTGDPGTGNTSPPPTTGQITPNPNQKRCQKWAPTGESHTESRWNPQTQTMETVSVPNFGWQDIPCE